MFLVPCCAVRYDFCIETMFGLSLPPVFCREVHVLFTLYVFFVHSSAQHILCCVFVFVCLVYTMLLVSLDCPLLIAPSVFSNIYLDHILWNQDHTTPFLGPSEVLLTRKFVGGMVERTL